MLLKKRVNKLFKSLLLTTSALLTLSGCPKYQPIHIPKEPLSKLTLQGEKFDFEKSKIIKYANYSSDVIVTVIRDIHQDEVIQREVYKTLEELTEENNSKFLGIENLHEIELSKEKLSSVGMGLAKDIIEDLLKAENKEKIIDEFCFKNHFCEAKVIFEMVKGDKVYTCGVEKEELLEKAFRIAKKYVEQEEIFNKIINENENYDDLDEKTKKEIEKYAFYNIQFNEIVIKQRSHVFVTNLITKYYTWKHKGNKSKIIMLVAGGDHYETIAEKLEEFKISYIILKPNSYVELLENIKLMKIKQAHSYH
ncbi:MAG: hypothetical protein KKA65_02415 [Nanoarchaeota archaeon]|nr:hypothetical protein [Nanoarchaeota archaeon]MBU4351870.1 hypothetical protein [Nanoarchaeota archaeon]MBU4456330.1 hypothetical protein [Nanoarchaeota archaeon]MCG2719975.1 hypothetical protein [Nanoarchaeota archaeon]